MDGGGDAGKKGGAFWEEGGVSFFSLHVGFPPLKGRGLERWGRGSFLGASLLPPLQTVFLYVERRCSLDGGGGLLLPTDIFLGGMPRKVGGGSLFLWGG